MEVTCSRCHQTMQEDACYCPVCGLPQLVYSVEENSGGQDQPERWKEAVRDAGSIAWKPALRSALMLAIPTGILCNMLSPVGILGMPLMAIAGAWVVVLYMRSQRPAWITIGAGARIGLVTGLLGGWTAAATTGVTLFALRFWFHQGKYYDDFWLTLTKQMDQEWNAMGVDSQTINQMQQMLMPPEGRAAWLLAALTLLAAVMLVFAIVGGALGARLLARQRRPEI